MCVSHVACYADDKNEDDESRVKGRGATGKGKTGKAMSVQQRPSRVSRRRPQGLCDTPSPPHPSKRGSAPAQPTDTQHAEEEEQDAPAAPAVDEANKQEDAKPPVSQQGTKGVPATEDSPALQRTDALLDLQQRLSTGIPDDEVKEQGPEAGAPPVKRSRRGASAAAVPAKGNDESPCRMKLCDCCLGLHCNAQEILPSIAVLGLGCILHDSDHRAEYRRPHVVDMHDDSQKGTLGMSKLRVSDTAVLTNCIC